MLYQAPTKSAEASCCNVLTVLLKKLALQQTKAMGKKDEGTPETVRKAKVE